MPAFSRFTVAAVACALALVACSSSPTEPELLGVELDFNVTRPAFLPDFSTVHDDGTLTVRGTIAPVCQPATAQAQVVRQGDLLVLTVATEGLDGCMESTVAVGYDAVISGFTSLRQLRVVHRWPGTQREDAVAYESVWD